MKIHFTILSALKELRDYYDIHVELMTPGGSCQELLEVWAEESEAYENGYIDPNAYYVDPAAGIGWIDSDGNKAGLCYTLKTGG
jgi:hypothetical protein